MALKKVVRHPPTYSGDLAAAVSGSSASGAARGSALNTPSKQFFRAGTYMGAFGYLTIDALGDWTYTKTGTPGGSDSDIIHVALKYPYRGDSCIAFTLTFAGGGGSAPVWAPVDAIAFADFVEAHGWTDADGEGDSAMMFAPESNYGPYDPATDYGDSGLGGQYVSFPEFSGAAKTALLAGATVLIDVTFSGVNGESVGLYYTNEDGQEKAFADIHSDTVGYVGPQQGAQETLLPTVDYQALRTGTHRLALTYVPGVSISGNNDGDVVGVSNGVVGFAPTAVFLQIVGGGCKVSSIAIYPAKSDTELGSLSALPPS